MSKAPLAAMALFTACVFLAPDAPGQTVEFVGVGYNSTNTICSTNGVTWVQGDGLPTNDSWSVTVYGNGLPLPINGNTTPRISAAHPMKFWSATVSRASGISRSSQCVAASRNKAWWLYNSDPLRVVCDTPALRKAKALSTGRLAQVLWV